MGGKLEDLEFKNANFTPGPGRYDSQKKQGIPSMKFGTGTRTSLDGGKEARGKPGPGVYSANPANVQRAAPKYGFGTDERDELSKVHPKTPGPGQYMARTFTGFENPRFSMG
mmetsp:Transcript_20986/g.28230  ORF Transcript_20986/g.28230 Transcript_20986/m.28230 type:complete len:112 (+) Transcript_20986:86-421(+)